MSHQIEHPYESLKAAEVCGLLVHLEARTDGAIDWLKLVKLAYLVERESWNRRLRPVFGGHYRSMPHGPAPQDLLDDSAVTQRTSIYSARPAPVTDPEHLSPAEVRIVKDVHRAYGHLSGWELRNLTHSTDEFPEYRDPAGSALPLPAASILRDAFGKLESDLDEAEAHAADARALRELFG